MKLLVVGTLAYDSVKTCHDSRDQILGGSASFLAACASYFCPVQMVGIVGEDFAPEHLDFFTRHNIDIQGVERAPGKTFRWSGEYEENMNIRHTLSTDLNVLECFQPDLPLAYRDTEYLVLGNFDPDLQLSVLNQLNRPKLVACDTMNFWIADYRAALEATLTKVDVLLVNDSEARQLSGEHNLVKAARAVRRLGPRIVVVKLGEQGALLFDEDSVFLAPALLLERVVDPTGAGDSFAGGMMGYLARHNVVDGSSLRQAMIVGAVMASFSVQDFSVDAVAALSRAQIAERLAELNALTQVDLQGIQLD